MNHQIKFVMYKQANKELIFMNRMIYINTCQISLSFTELCCQHFYNKENQIWGSNVKVCGYIIRSPS